MRRWPWSVGDFEGNEAESGGGHDGGGAVCGKGKDLGVELDRQKGAAAPVTSYRDIVLPLAHRT
jgi:hypothetical protein